MCVPEWQKRKLLTRLTLSSWRASRPSGECDPIAIMTQRHEHQRSTSAADRPDRWSPHSGGAAHPQLRGRDLSDPARSPRSLPEPDTLTELVGSVLARLDIPIEQDERPDERDEHEQQPPAAAADVVQPA